MFDVSYNRSEYGKSHQLLSRSITSALLDNDDVPSYVFCMINALFNIRLAPEYLKWLDEMRRKEEDIPNRSEMARRCIERQAKLAGVIEREGKRK